MEEIGKLIMGLLVGIIVGHTVIMMKESRSSKVFLFYLILYTVVIVTTTLYRELL